MAASAFPNYTRVSSLLSVRSWQAIRVASLTGALALASALIVAPDQGLFVFWELLIPLLPLLFLVAPGLWRNICPLAASNQTPRVLGFTRGLTAPDWLKDYGYLFAVGMFLLLVSLRKVGLDDEGAASAALVLGALGSAFVGGFVLKGKSGWCSSICPLLPVQRVYGQTPFALVTNTHCQPCVGCTKNCYDFNPRVAYLADLHDDDAYWGGRRKLFAGAFPGLVYWFYTAPDVADASAGQVYGELGLAVAVSLAAFALLDLLLKLSSHTLTTLFGAAAFTIFYWHAGPGLVESVSDAESPDAVTWALRAAAFGLSAAWVVRTYRKEKVFLEEAPVAPAAPRGITNVSRTGSVSLVLHSASRAGNPEVAFVDEGKRVAADPGTTLLEVAEGNGLKIEAGCRMGVCGADPVAIKEGMENLSPVSDDERGTLERLGFAENTRMACCCRVEGPVSVALEPERPARPTASQIAGFDYDRSVERVVVIGNGIAGVTAADHVRRRHPLCHLDVVAQESHHLYNRMAISRLVYGRSAMQGLYLNPESWEEEHAVTVWLNTRARAIDREAKQVLLGTGETLPYDRLILATGSSSRLPPIDGYGGPGTFVLRSADDALALRAFTQRNLSERAIVAGGGLLGLEAGYALHKLGMRVTVVEPADRLLPRQLDDRAGAFLDDYLENLGIEVLLGTSPTAVSTNGRVREVALSDERSLPADIFLVCAGNEPNVELAREAGLEVRHGVVVDDHMRTSDPLVFAAGDVAEHRGEMYGLWPVAVDQGATAAENAVGGDRAYRGEVPATILKVVGIELASVGRFEPEPGEEAIVLEDEGAQRYAKLVISTDGTLAGAILLGYSQEVSPVTTAVKRGLDASEKLDDLRAGRLGVLSELSGDQALVPAAAARPGS